MLMFDDVEVLDFAGPFEVFSVANAGLRVVTVGTKPEITARNRMVVRPTGIDGAFHVLARLAGREVAEETARYIEYPLALMR